MHTDYFAKQEWYKQIEEDRLDQIRDDEAREADITYRRHLGNMQSQMAHQRIVKTKEQQRDDVLELIGRFPDGLSMKEVAQHLGLELNTISGRGVELKKMGKVEKTGVIRNGSAVLRFVNGST